MKVADIHQTLVFPTDAADFYNCIMNSRIHSSFTGNEAIIEDKEGSDFSAFGGYITGKNIILERGKKIVQTWKTNEEDWPEDYFSEVVFMLKDTTEGCEVTFFHVAVPLHKVESLEKGWQTYYWDPVRIFFER